MKLNLFLYQIFFLKKKILKTCLSYECDKILKKNNLKLYIYVFLILIKNYKTHNYIYILKKLLNKNIFLFFKPSNIKINVNKFFFINKKFLTLKRIKIINNSFYFIKLDNKFTFIRFFNSIFIYSKTNIFLNKLSIFNYIRIKSNYNFIVNPNKFVLEFFKNNYRKRVVLYDFLLTTVFENNNSNDFVLSQNNYVKIGINNSNRKTLKYVFKKKLNFNINYFLNYVIYINDFFFINDHKNIINFISNKVLTNYLNFFDLNSSMFNCVNENYSKNKIKNYNNYYPILLSNKIIKKNYFSNYKNNYSIDFISFTNKFVISFLEKNFKKFIYIKYINNYFCVINNNYLDIIIKDHKNYQPAFWKNFLVFDFINLIWYSFFFRDLNIISEWISVFMETLNFKNHKKFLTFFLNFVNKYSDVFVNVLNVKGFFFDIRGKVGVTGSSKKRHFFFKFGTLNKSSKKTKINFNQSLVRTYSGVLGLTYIINY